MSDGRVLLKNPYRRSLRSMSRNSSIGRSSIIGIKPTSLTGRNCYLLLRYFTGKYLDEITSDMVEDFKLARIREIRSNARDGRAITPVTVNRALTTLQLIFKRAAGDNMDGIKSHQGS